MKRPVRRTSRTLPCKAGRSQTLYRVEIIATQQAAHVGITLGLEASAHQPGWSLWLM